MEKKSSPAIDGEAGVARGAEARAGHDQFPKIDVADKRHVRWVGDPAYNYNWSKRGSGGGPRCPQREQPASAKPATD